MLGSFRNKMQSYASASSKLIFSSIISKILWEFKNTNFFRSEILPIYFPKLSFCMKYISSSKFSKYALPSSFLFSDISSFESFSSTSIFSS